MGCGVSLKTDIETNNPCDNINDVVSLKTALNNTLWQWDGTFGEQIFFKENGNVEHEGWTQRGLVTIWKPIDRRTVLFKIEQGRNTDLYAILIFNEELNSFTGQNFHQGSELRLSKKLD